MASLKPRVFMAYSTKAHFGIHGLVLRVFSFNLGPYEEASFGKYVLFMCFLAFLSKSSFGLFLGALLFGKSK